MKLDWKGPFLDFFPDAKNKAIEPTDLMRSNITRVCKSTELVVEVKFDGSFYVGRIHDGTVCFSSKRLSVHGGKPVDKTPNLPQLSSGGPSLHETIVLGEITMPGGFKDVMSIMGSSPEKAAAKIAEMGHPTYVIFDCVVYKGEDMRTLTYRQRMDLLHEVYARWKNPLVTISKQHDWVHAVQVYEDELKRGGEGVMVKDLNSPYGKGVFKCKKHADVSVFVSGYTEAEEGKTGKYKGQIGAILFSCWHEGKDVEIGQCSGMDDAARLEISANRSKYIGQVMDVRSQPPDNPAKWDPNNHRLRHPRFVRFRDDLGFKQCTSEKIRQDFKDMMKQED